MNIQVSEEGVIQSTQVLPVEEISLAEHLERVFSKHSQKLAFISLESEKQYTYGELLEICKSIAAVLQKQGLNSQDLVVFTASTTVRSCCVFLALVFCQVSIVCPRHSYTEYELGAVLRNISSLKLAIGDNESKSKLRNAINVDILDIDTVWDLGQAASFRQPSEVDPETAVLLIFFTSGSTGPSKAVCISHTNLIANLAQWQLNSGRFLLCNPITHLSGALCLIATMARAEVVCAARETLKGDLNSYVDVCAKYRIKQVFAMPVLLNSLAKFGFSDKLATIECILTGGSKVPQPTIDELLALYPHIDIQNVYGASECCVVLKSTAKSELQHLNVCPNVQLKIVDLKSGETLGPNQNGMLYCKSPSVALGYYNNKEATEEAFIHGWYVTGDLAYRDERGRIVIVDRVKQMIKCLDSQVAPADLEMILIRDKQVLKALVCGIPHPSFGEAAIAFVVPKEQSDLEEVRKRLVQSVETNCAYYKHLHGGLFFVDNIPETDSGKFSRKDIVEMHLNNELKYLS